MIWPRELTLFTVGWILRTVLAGVVWGPMVNADCICIAVNLYLSEEGSMEAMLSG